MKRLFNMAFGWLQERDRVIHLLGGFLAAAVCSIGAAVVAGITAEYKDWCYAGQKGGVFGIFQRNTCFDWLDLLATFIGGVFGGIFHYMVLGHIHL